MSGFAAIHRLSKIKLKPFTGITYYNSMEGKSKIPNSIQVGMNDLGGLAYILSKLFDSGY